jgi:triphosphatase
VSAAGRSDTVSEVELELKRGRPAALFGLARDLGRDLPLRVGVLTKAQRGYRLLETVSAGSVKTERLTLRSDATAAEAFASIADACLRQFRLNEDILRRDPQADALHQARVALRRLRSALSLFKPILADAKFDHLAGELRWIAGSLGEARDLDVLVARVGDEPDEAIIAAHRIAYSEALAFLDLVEWATLGEWRTQPVKPERVNERADLFAAQVLGRLRRRLKRRGRDLTRLDDGERHRVRILGKKLRYAAGFLESLYAGKEARQRFRAFLKRVEALQDHLGELNDVATAPALVARVGLKVDDLSPSGHRGSLLAKAERAYRKWVDAKPFW